jgi:hypothetical protein
MIRVHSVRVLSAVLLAGCTSFVGSRPPAFVPDLAVTLTAVNFSSRRVPFEFRVDGVRIVDTTVAVGGIPPLVLAQRIHLSPGHHRLELYDKRDSEYHTQTFDVRPTDMTIEIRLFDQRSELKTYYAHVGYA